MAKSCNACGKYISATGAAACSICLALYHKACVSLSETSPVVKGWVCPGCTTRTRKGDNTPVRGAPQDAIAPRASAVVQRTTPGSSPGAPVTHVVVPDAPTAIAMNLQDMHREIGEWMCEMREFRKEMSDFRASVRGLNVRVDTLEVRLEAIERQVGEAPSTVADLQSQVAILQRELNDRDQDALLSDLEIGHLPEQRGESVVHAVTVLAAKLGVTLEERDIVFAERVGIAQGAAAAGTPLNPRRVVVRLARRNLRDQMLQGARVRRTLTAADAGYAGCSVDSAGAAPRIFINERLTRANRQLFHRVREESRRLHWRFVWTKRGRVYARQGDGKQAFPIRSDVDVVRVFGLSSG